jgi:hypothetical protein
MSQCRSAGLCRIESRGPRISATRESHQTAQCRRRVYVTPRAVWAGPQNRGRVPNRKRDNRGEFVLAVGCD